MRGDAEPVIYEQRSRNLWTSRLIGVTFLAVVVFIAYAGVTLVFGGDAFVLALVLTLVVAALVAGYLKSDRWVLGRFDDQFLEPERRVRGSLEQMALAAGVKTPVLYELDTGTLNAFAVGREPDRGIVVVTKGLIEKLEPEELQGVLAHEVAHIRDGDSMAGSLIALVAWLADRVFVASWYLLLLALRMIAGGLVSPMLVLLPVVSLLLPVGGRLAQMAFSRSREYLADVSAVLLTRDPEGMIGALQKLEAMSTVVARANVATSHLFVAPTESIWDPELFSTHPPLAERIDRLRHVTAVPVQASGAPDLSR